MEKRDTSGRRRRRRERLRTQQTQTRDWKRWKAGRRGSAGALAPRWRGAARRHNELEQEAVPVALNSASLGRVSPPCYRHAAPLSIAVALWRGLCAL